MFPVSAATIVVCTVSSAPPPDLARERRLRVDERRARRRDPARRLRGPRLARGPADRRRAGDRARSNRRCRWARRSSACASASASPARRSACPPWSSPTRASTPRPCWAAGATEPRGRGRDARAARARARPAAAGRPARPRGRARDGPAGDARGGAGHVARRERTPVAAAVRWTPSATARRRSPGCCASSASSQLGRQTGARPRAARARRGLRRPGASHARGAAALRAHAGRARRVRRRARGRTCPFRSSGRRAGRVPSGRMIDRAEAYIWTTARVLEQRRFEVLFSGRRPRGGRRPRWSPTRPRTAATATRWSPTGAGRRASRRTSGPRWRRWRTSARPTRACRDHLADDHRARRRRARRHCRTCEPGRARRGGRSATEGSLLATALLFAPLSKHVAHPWLGRAEAFLWDAVDAIEQDAPVRGRGGDHVPRRGVRPPRGPRRRRSGSAGSCASRTSSASSPRATRRARSTTRTTSPPTRTASPARGSATPRSTPRSTCSSRASSRARRLGHHVGRLDARDQDRVERAGDDRSAQDAAIVRTRC